MDIEFNFNGASFVAGAVFLAIGMGHISLYFLILGIVLLTTFKVKGAPYCSLNYQSGEGWSLVKGRY
jgi:hypothetical protein